MWWYLLPLFWWCGTTAVPDPGDSGWKCPEITEEPIVECNCDIPHTLRCTGDKSAMRIIGRHLRSLDPITVSLLDCTIQNVSSLSEPLLEGVALHGLVVSSGEIQTIHRTAFQGLAAPLQALGLPNNQLTSVPTHALKSLPELDRLDLSSNKLKSLESQSFKGLRNLSFIDLSNNEISKIHPSTFSRLLHLKVLRLRGNKLKIPILSKLSGLLTIDELDLSSNEFVGPLGSHTFPNMPALRDLQLSYNSFSSIKMGALEGLPKLESLALHSNQIDVLEDHAFLYLSRLITLNLSNNRIVAVSGSSLAHLKSLVHLDLRHNFLRALTPDLIAPLKKLQSLRLDDNDISIVSSDAMKSGTVLKRLTLTENPLNCDCSLAEFAIWLSNSSLSKEDKSSAVCATPPSLENGVLIEIPLKQLLCGDEQESLLSPLAVPVKAHISLRNFSYDGQEITLEWYVEEKAAPYTCDAIFVYEEEGPNEVLLESNPLRCNSSHLKDPRILDITVPNSFDLVLGHKYRFCVVLLESASNSDEISLVLGCSDVISLIPDHYRIQESTTVPKQTPKITAIQTDFSSDGTLSVMVRMQPVENCELNVALHQNSVVLMQKRNNCTNIKHTFSDLAGSDYTLCVNTVQVNGAMNDEKPQCLRVMKEQPRKLIIDAGLVFILFLLGSSGVFLIFAVQKCLKKPKVTTHQCFLPPEQGERQHNRYVKLQATTKL